MRDESSQQSSSRASPDSFSVTRKARRSDPPEQYQFGRFRLEPAECKLFRDEEIVSLTPKAFETLLLLVRNSGHLVEKEELIGRLWPDTFVEEGSLSNNIFLLRKALGENPQYIETVSRRGYRFVGAVRALPNCLPPGIAKPSIAAPALAPPQKRKSTRSALVVGAIFVSPLLLGLLSWYGRPRVQVAGNAVKITDDGKAKNALFPPVSDGIHLYLTEGSPWIAGSAIAQVSAVGGETTQIATPLSRVLAVFAISPDGSHLLVANGDIYAIVDPVSRNRVPGGELWMQPLPAGTPHRVGDIHAFAACWTPDGNRIIYADQHGVMVANPDGSDAQQLTSIQGVVLGIRVSPDGETIRLSVSAGPESGFTSIWEMNRDGKNLHRLLPDWKVSQFGGSWSSDGRYYYFQAGSGNDQAIWATREGGFFGKLAEPHPTRLVSGPLRFSSPVPSHDDKKLFVVGDEPRTELLRYDPRTHRFDSYLRGISATTFDISPDRNWIAYVSYPDMNLWRSRPDGSDKIQLTFPPVRAYGPTWSPDGSTIGFTDMRFDHPRRVGYVSASGGVAQYIPATTSSEFQEDPTWMPDGKSIVFAKSNGPEPGSHAIYRLDPKSHAESLITDSQGLSSPRVSPDGRFISAFSESQSKLMQLMLFDTKTKRWSTLVKSEMLACNLWSHDGKFIYFRETSGGPPSLARVSIKDHTLERVLNLKDFPQRVDIYAAWFGLTPDDVPILIGDRSLQETYALDIVK